MGAGLLATALVAVLTAAFWGTVRDHVEAWHFQLTRETRMLEPITSLNDEGELIAGLQILSYSGRSVIFDPNQGVSRTNTTLWEVRSMPTVDEMLRVFREDGYRILEQRFPRRAFVVIRAQGMTQEDDDISRFLQNIIGQGGR